MQTEDNRCTCRPIRPPANARAADILFCIFSKRCFALETVDCVCSSMRDVQNVLQLDIIIRLRKIFTFCLREQNSLLTVLSFFM